MVDGFRSVIDGRLPPVSQVHTGGMGQETGGKRAKCRPKGAANSMRCRLLGQDVLRLVLEGIDHADTGEDLVILKVFGQEIAA